MADLSKFLATSLPPPTVRALHDCQPCRRNRSSCTSMYSGRHRWRVCACVEGHRYIFYSFPPFVSFCTTADGTGSTSETQQIMYPDSLSPWYNVWMKHQGHRNKDTSTIILINYKVLGINFAQGSMQTVSKNFLKNWVPESISHLIYSKVPVNDRKSSVVKRTEMFEIFWSYSPTKNLDLSLQRNLIFLSLHLR